MTMISSSSTIGINLTPAFYTSSVVIETGVTITNPNYLDAVYTPSASSTVFAVQNDGTIIGAATSSGVGVYLAPGGSVTNAVKGTIAGYTGVKISRGTGTIVNGGSILGGGHYGYGVDLLAGGSVTNASGASIASDDPVHGVRFAVRISGNTGTVVNDGNILGGGANAVFLYAGGSIINGTSGVIQSNAFDAIFIGNGAGTLVNEGSVTDNVGPGIELPGGLVTNAASASITGGAVGVQFDAYPGGSVVGGGTVINDGVIVSPGFAAYGGGSAGGVAVQLNISSFVTNEASGTISGVAAGVQAIAVATVVNDGIIAGGAGGGINLGTGGPGSGGSVTNAASGSITGVYGVYLNSGTLTNAGMIVGNGGTAVLFGGTGSSRLILDPGFRFSGLVVGSTSTSASNALELASGMSTGTVTGLGSQYLHFQSIVLDPGADWSITGLQRGLAGPISGFAHGDTIELTGVTATGSSFSGGILTLEETGGSATLDLPGTFSLANFDVTAVAGGTEVTFVACFAVGAHILTASGEVPVENLRIGDQVATLGGRRMAPIVWLGHRHIDCSRHPVPEGVWPICIKAGALADGIPHRDLWLSPDHAVLLRSDAEAMLVPARHLVNGTTVVQVPVPSVTYWHVELASHDVIVAEGMAAETYLDTGNRADFDRGGPAVIALAAFAGAV